MSEQDDGEYDLADLPEPKKAKQPAPPPAKPLPRLWKTEDDEAEDETPAKAAAESPGPAGASGRPAEVRRRAPALKAPEAKKPTDNGSDKKKVLIEDTPAMDTYEARQRGRLVIGALAASCFGLFGWIFYQLFIYDPNPIELNGDEPPPPAVAAAPVRDLDVEARSMFDRAKESAKAGRTDEAIKMLGNVVKSYAGTKTAVEAKEALDRPGSNLPLFLDRPAVKAEAAAKPEPAPAAQPPKVVLAEPPRTAGNASLTLPANPAELTPTHPSPLAMAPGATGAIPATARKLTPPPGFKAQTESGYHASGWPLVIVGDRDGAPMVFVPGGTFLMGNDNGPAAEGPAHKVKLSPYYIDQHEVTVRQYRLFLAEAHYRGQPPKSWSEEFRQNTTETLPMVMVNARDAQAYADWAQKKLPTEAQWEMSARSTDGRLHPWGSESSVGARPQSATRPEPVGSFPADVSPYGVKDLGGNVLEWTKDWYDSKAYRGLPLEGTTNPTGPAVRPRSMELVVKGDRKAGTASARQGMMLEKRLNYVGFRCALPVTEAQGAVAVSPPAGGSAPGPVPGQSPQPRPAAAPSTPAPEAGNPPDASVPF